MAREHVTFNAKTKTETRIPFTPAEEAEAAAADAAGEARAGTSRIEAAKQDALHSLEEDRLTKALDDPAAPQPVKDYKALLDAKPEGLRTR